MDAFAQKDASEDELEIIPTVVPRQGDGYHAADTPGGVMAAGLIGEAGKTLTEEGGTIRRFTEHLNPRTMRVVALLKPTDDERGQWYVQRYIRQLPNKGEIVFFDWSWCNRAVVEPVMGFCSKKEHQRFLQQVTDSSICCMRTG